MTPLVGQISSVDEDITLWQLDLAVVSIRDTDDSGSPH